MCVCFFCGDPPVANAVPSREKRGSPCRPSGVGFPPIIRNTLKFVFTNQKPARPKSLSPACCGVGFLLRSSSGEITVVLIRTGTQQREEEEFPVPSRAFLPIRILSLYFVGPIRNLRAPKSSCCQLLLIAREEGFRIVQRFSNNQNIPFRFFYQPETFGHEIPLSYCTYITTGERRT